MTDKDAAEEDDGTARALRGWTGTEREAIEARKKRAERGWIVEPPVPYPDYGPAEEIERWYAVIGVRGSELS